MNNDNRTTLWILGVVVLTVLAIIGIARYQNTNNNDKNEVLNTNTINPPTGSKPEDGNVNPTTSPKINNQQTKKNMEYPTKVNETVERSDGLKITMLVEGTGTVVSKPGDSVVVSYKGMLVDGTVFDQGTLPPMTVGGPGLIVGFDRGMTGMKVGETRRVFIPSALGYGSRGAGAKIPPNSDLIFEITLKEIK